jgi:integrase
MINNTIEKASRDWGVIKRKEKDGNEVWYARIIRVDGSGKKKQYLRKADNKTHARRLRDELEQQFDERGEMAIAGDKMRFRDLAEIYEKRKLFDAEYHGIGKARRKVAGVRSLAPSQHYLNVLREYFGSKLLKSITHSEIEDFKAKRLKEPSIRGERSIADVNRALELLRTIMRFANRNGWLSKSPFEMGDSLISKANEVKRERVLSFDEESRLLGVCTGERPVSYIRNGKEVHTTRKGGREHLKALIIVALDTAMRKGELLKLRWHDVNFPMRLITITAMNSKTSKERKIGMTQRVFQELETLWNKSPQDPEILVFGIKDNFQNGFTNILNEAKIEDFRFHDIRHTAITRMVNAGLPPMEIMKVSGHTQWTTFARYVNPNEDTVKRIADVLGAYHANATTKNRSEESFIN